MSKKVLILDFGSQVTQLIARRVRELGVYCEIKPYNSALPDLETLNAVILSGSPFSVKEERALKMNLNGLLGNLPVLGICYGAQYIAHHAGGQVSRSEKREYGKANLTNINSSDTILNGIDNSTQVWMSHGDTIEQIPPGFKLIAGTEHVDVAIFRSDNGRYKYPIYGLQFHPEVTHSLQGKIFLSNFLFEVAQCESNWTPASFVDESISQLKSTIGKDQVIMALSGGVDSTVGAMLLHRAIGSQLSCIFVDNGLLRQGEYVQVLKSYEHMGLNIKGVDAKDMFYSALKGVTDPEHKRKIIGKLFIDVFEQEASEMPEVKWLGQGTIYPDVIESVSVHGPSVTIKSHHNVGGLPEKLNLKIVEPLRMLFKDEVRKVGGSLEISNNILQRHPFPGPGLAIRILGDITAEKVDMLQQVDRIFVEGLKSHDLYNEIWQAGAILLPVKSVGVMGDERSYEQAVALRAVNSTDGMTAEWSRLPYEFLAKISTDIINNVKGINRVVYDISTKPPATIEWE